MITHTHTYVIMELSPAAYDEIYKKMKDAGYDHALHQDSDYKLPVIDMNGIAVAVQKEPEPTRNASAKRRKKLRSMPKLKVKAKAK